MKTTRFARITTPSARAPLAVLFALVIAASPAAAQVDSAANGPLTVPGSRLELFPGSDGYTDYIADPHRPTNSAGLQFHTATSIEGASERRSWLAAGGRFGLLRLNPATPGGRAWQFAIEAGLDAQYDWINSLDNLGYDGNYGLTLTTSGGGFLEAKLGVRHTSSHVGDEWTRETGRQRIGYTREEFLLGVAGRMAGHLRLYGETGYAYHQNSDLQRPWRIQAGGEAEWPRIFAGGLLGLYAAGDVQSWEERDYRLDAVVETGVLAYSGTRRWRFGVRYSDGRGPLGEFFQETEKWFTFGLWVDL